MQRTACDHQDDGLHRVSVNKFGNEECCLMLDTEEASILTEENMKSKLYEKYDECRYFSVGNRFIQIAASRETAF